MGCGCIGHRHSHQEVRPEQKWDYISLNDFKSNSCWTPFAYGYLYYLLILSIVVYGVDTFTAVNLLAFDRWPSEIEPGIPFAVSKWIFSVCIILSFLNLGYEHIRANRIMRRGSVAECYLDSLAARLESARMGKGQGYKRFLVFAELTKSKKGAEYVALFTYFSFQSWFQTIFCFGPRQVVNAVTLYSVYNTRIAATGPDVGNTLLDFFRKVKELAEQDTRLAVIIGSMLFTLVVWVLSVLSMLAGIFCFVFFLWGYLPKEDGNLSNYCSRKINKRLMQIVAEKVNKGIMEEDRKRREAASYKAGARLEHKPTLPNIGGDSDSLPSMPSISRTETMTTLPPYASRPGTPGSFELSKMDQKRPLPPTRTGTMASSASGYSARQPLMGAAADFGMNSPAPSLPPIDYNNPSYAASVGRTGTMSTNRSTPGPHPGVNRMQSNTSLASGYTNGPHPGMNRMQSNTSLASGYTNGGGYSSETAPPMPRHMPSNGSFDRGYTSSPAPYSSENSPAMPPPVAARMASPGPGRGPQMQPGYHRPQQSNHSLLSNGSNGAVPSPMNPMRYDEYANGRASPAPSLQSYRGAPMSPAGPLGPQGAGGYPHPQRSATGPIAPRPTGPPRAPMRNMTAPVESWEQEQQRQPQQPPAQAESDDIYDDYFNRPPTSQSMRQQQPQPQQQQQPARTGGGGFGSGWAQDLESQRGGTPGPRGGTPGPRY